MATENDLLRVVLAVLAVIVLAPVLMMLFMMPMMGMWGGPLVDGGMMTSGATWLWALMWLVPLAVVVGIGYLVYRVVRPASGGGTDPAVEELRLAYARGDLTDEEFEERRDRLRRE